MPNRKHVLKGIVKSYDREYAHTLTDNRLLSYIKYLSTLRQHFVWRNKTQGR